jgi:beta-phosphoglucomutase-like phosphatase (HAD superfamily)
VIEDSAVGVEAGAAAGMTVFGYAAMTNPDALRAAGAAHVFTRMDALPELLARARSVNRAGAAPPPAGAP